MKINQTGNKCQRTYNKICKNCGCDFSYSEVERQIGYFNCPQCGYCLTATKLGPVATFGIIFGGLSALIGMLMGILYLLLG